jgi:hypothetical protein
VINQYKHPVLDIKSLAHDFIFGSGKVQEEHLKMFLDKLHKMPKEYQEAFPFWDEHFRETSKITG